ncbi:MAG: hypothetical protein KatS3mg014_1375 [Actinomycetota bacterium]|nr:MAG: hypothetical protein KatS3mg014_1375 [Actinomycetota bacterium]
MAVNLVRNYTREQAHHLLNSSFAQFLADRGVVALERELERDRAYLAGYRDGRWRCHLGDFARVLGACGSGLERIRAEARLGAGSGLSDGGRPGRRWRGCGPGT